MPWLPLFGDGVTVTTPVVGLVRSTRSSVPLPGPAVPAVPKSSVPVAVTNCLPSVRPAAEIVPVIDTVGAPPVGDTVRAPVTAPAEVPGLTV